MNKKILEREHINFFNMECQNKISLQESWGNSRLKLKVLSNFHFSQFFGKMIAAPPGCKSLGNTILAWAHSLGVSIDKYRYKVPSGIC